MQTVQLQSSMNSESAVRGRQTPRIWTPPLRELTPETSFGYDVIDFAEQIGWPLDEWQQWVVIHLGELLEDGRPRFRMALILVARQNGKTVLCRVLTLYWMFIEMVELILGTSTSRDTAKESWRKVIAMAEDIDILYDELDPVHTRETTGEEAFWNIHGSKYRFAAPNRRAGRSFTVHRTIFDEIREHQDFDTYDAAMGAMNAVRDAQAVAITNQGDKKSVVLDSLRDSALEYIETGNGDPRLFLAEWSAPNGCDPMDLEALAMANPDLGNRIDPDALLGMAMRAKRAGGIELAGFRTEIMCQRVTSMDSAIDGDRWEALGADNPIALADHRDRLVLCLDVALDGSHSTLTGVAVIDGVAWTEVIEAWQGFGHTKAMRAELPALVRKVRPRAFGFFRGGPADAIITDLRGKGVKDWPPRRVDLIELTSDDAAAACMGLADFVNTGSIRHPHDALQTAHLRATQKLWRGDRWVFTRRNAGPIDGAYSLAGALHMARDLKPGPPPLAMA